MINETYLIGYKHGGRVLLLKENTQSITSWFRLEDGSILAQQVEHHPDSRDRLYACHGTIAEMLAVNSGRIAISFGSSLLLLCIALSLWSQSVTAQQRVRLTIDNVTYLCFIGCYIVAVGSPIQSRNQQI
jgi:hypothetical protein